jgi:hypothetical protein
MFFELSCELRQGGYKRTIGLDWIVIIRNKLATRQQQKRLPLGVVNGQSVGQQLSQLY